MNALGWIGKLLPFTLPGWAATVLGVLFTFVPIPVIAILGVLGWWQFDKNSAIKTAVRKSITEFVTGAELASLKAELESERRISRYLQDQIDKARKRAEQDAEALSILLAEKQMQEITIQDQEDEIAEIMAGRNAAVPTVADLNLVDRLRHR